MARCGLTDLDGIGSLPSVSVCVQCLKLIFNQHIFMIVYLANLIIKNILIKIHVGRLKISSNKIKFYLKFPKLKFTVP